MQRRHGALSPMRCRRHSPRCCPRSNWKRCGRNCSSCLSRPSVRELTQRDWKGALGLCLLSFATTFPVVIPFIFISDPKLALQISNAVALVMLFGCGYAFGIQSGLKPWAAGLSMTAFGGALVGIAVALGG